MASNDIFEKESVSSAIIKLAIPTIVSSLVTVIYNLADTYFVGLLNDPVQTAAVPLAAPALLAFNAIINLFGVGTSSAMSRALGRGDSNLVRRCSVFGLYCAFISSVLFSVFTGLFRTPLLGLLGASAKNAAATSEYMRWAVTCGAVPSRAGRRITYPQIGLVIPTGFGLRVLPSQNPRARTIIGKYAFHPAIQFIPSV